MKKIINEFALNDMAAAYVKDESGRVGLEIVPAGKRQNVKSGRVYETMLHGRRRSPALRRGRSSYIEKTTKIIF